jgi:hypothetical protein
MGVCDSSNLGWNAVGTFIYMGDGASPENWTKIAKVDNVDGPAGTTATSDVTTHDTPNGFKQFLANLSDSGACALSLVWDPTDPTHVGTGFSSLKQAFDDKQNRHWKIVFPTSPKYKTVFCGFVDAYKHMSPVAGALKANISIKVSDSFVIGPGS